MTEDIYPRSLLSFKKTPFTSYVSLDVHSDVIAEVTAGWRGCGAEAGGEAPLFLGEVVTGLTGL